jgi:hypothetical protein
MGSAIRVGLEGTHGTIATTFVSVPCAWTAKLRQKNSVPAEGRMGQDVHFTVVPGLRHEEWEISESPIYHDTFGKFLAMALGTPTKTTVDTVFSNVFKLQDDPKSATIEWTQPHRSTQPFQVLWAAVDELAINFDVAGDLTFEASGVSMPESNIAAPAYAFSTSRAFSGWACTVTKGGSAFAKLVKGKITVKRNRKPFHTMTNSQDPSKMTIGDRTVDFDLVFDFDDTVEYAQWKAATVDALQLVFADEGVIIGTVTHPTLTVKMGSCAYVEDEIDDGSDLPSLKAKGVALYNVADASKIVANLISTKDYTA